MRAVPRRVAVRGAVAQPPRECGLPCKPPTRSHLASAASKAKSVRRGVKEVVKALRKKPAGCAARRADAREGLRLACHAVRVAFLLTFLTSPPLTIR